MADMVRHCWICGDLANSSEHMLKASELRDLFPGASNQKPFYIHPPGALNTEVPGVNSAKIKYSQTICSTCNNTRTQVHDRAWDQFSKSIRSRRPLLSQGHKLPSKDIFGSNELIGMGNVYRYLLKLFGCHCVEHNAPLPLSEIGAAILLGQQHPSITISFFALKPEGNKLAAYIGDLRVIRNSKGRPVCVAWWFGIESFGAIIQYHEQGHPAIYKIGWKPFDPWRPLKIN